MILLTNNNLMFESQNLYFPWSSFIFYVLLMYDFFGCMNQHLRFLMLEADLIVKRSLKVLLWLWYLSLYVWETDHHLGVNCKSTLSSLKKMQIV